MQFHNIYKIIISITLSTFITACTSSIVNNNNNISIIKEVKKEEKIIEYKRENISENLISRVYQIIQAMSVNNLTLINQKFIHPTFGFYNLYKIDGINIFTHQKIIYNILEEDMEEVCHLISNMRKLQDPIDIKLEEANFDCSPNNDEFYGWNKHGVFLNSSTNTYLTDIMSESNKFEKNRYKKEDFEKAKQIERTSYKVILSPNIVFYVTKIQGDWYLSLFDRITTDCS